MPFKRPWLTAEVRHLAILNYEVAAGLLSPYVPHCAEIDSWQGKCLVSIVAFLFRQPKVLGIPLPCCQEFEQANLRFYVRRRTKTVVRRGVVFIRELVPKHLVALIARYFFGENYVCLPMDHDVGFDEPRSKSHTKMEYRWYDHGRWHGIKIHADNNMALPEPGSQAAFSLERYWGYTLRSKGFCLEYRFEHPQWHVQQASAALTCDQENIFGSDFAASLFQKPSSAFITEGSKVSLFLPSTVKREKGIT
jgi:hypothetical protein